MSLKVVYVDDEPDLCELFKEYFEGDPLEIKTFSDPMKAVAYINKNDLDAAIFDFRMPVVNGEQAAQLVTKKVPIALVTGDLSVEPNPLFIRIFKKPLDFEQIRQFLLTL